MMPVPELIIRDPLSGVDHLDSEVVRNPLNKLINLFFCLLGVPATKLVAFGHEDNCGNLNVIFFAAAENSFVDFFAFTTNVQSDHTGFVTLLGQCLGLYALLCGWGSDAKCDPARWAEYLSPKRGS